MNVKELSDFTGKTERTIQRWVNKAAEHNDKMSLTRGNKTDFSIDEVEQILNSGSMSKDAVFILMKNAREVNNTIPEKKNNNDIDTAFKMAIVTLTNMYSDIDRRMSNIEYQVKERKALLPPPEMDKRQQISKIVNTYCRNSHSGYREAYGDLYREFNYIYHRNVNLSASNLGIKVIDFIEKINMLDELIAIAGKIFAKGQLL